MKDLKKTLQKDHSNKTKKELISLLKTIKKAVGPDYEEITGLTVNELTKTKNAELIAVIEEFNENFKDEWQKDDTAFSAVPRMLLTQALLQN